MDYFGRYNSQSYPPSAPSLPESYGQDQRYGASTPYQSGQHQHQHQHQQQQPPPPYGSNFGYGSSYMTYDFPPGTHPDVIRSFQIVDSDRSGSIDENELQRALSSGYQRFNLGTVRLLVFLFKNPNNPGKVGPKEFAALWSCLGQWRSVFEKYDKDRSGKIDAFEMRDALYGLGYAVPGSVLQLMISRYDDGSGRRVEFNFDCFVQCGMIVKGLTDKFKEKDSRYSGSATFTYEDFMSTVLPFLVSYN